MRIEISNECGDEGTGENQDLTFGKVANKKEGCWMQVGLCSEL